MNGQETDVKAVTAHTHPFWPTSSIISYAQIGIPLLHLALSENKIIS